MNPINRRSFVTLVTAGALGALTACAQGAAPASASGSAVPSSHSSASPLRADAEFAALEAEFDARLGLFLLNPRTGESVAYRADERFAFASTIKALQAGAILQSHDIPALDEIIHYTAEDLVPHSPITEQHVETGMPLRDVMTAALQYSDNTAANLMFIRLDGPAGLQNTLRGLGDQTISVDRIETALNEATPGDPRDTTTPRAHAETLGKYLLGDALPTDRRELLAGWMRANTTGDALIRAGVPEGWTVGDKTGGGYYGTRNDIAAIWPPQDDPLMLAVMSSRTAQDADYADGIIAPATRIALEALAAAAVAN